MEQKKKYDNIAVPISNYCTNRLQEALTEYGQRGFQLVNVTMAENRYGVNIMYLFFVRENENQPDDGEE